MKIAVMTDAHANLPALQAALEAIRAEGCDAVYHLGDAVGIGPYPAECVDLLGSTPDLHCTAGNHELYFTRGISDPLPDGMSSGEARHQHWTHARLGEARKALIEGWPLEIEAELAGVKAAFLHYGRTSSGLGFAPVVLGPSAADLERLFARQEAGVIFFGHDHAPCDIQGRAHYLNPGSLGCSREPLARYLVAAFERGGWRCRRGPCPMRMMRSTRPSRRARYLSGRLSTGRFMGAGSGSNGGRTVPLQDVGAAGTRACSVTHVVQTDPYSE